MQQQRNINVAAESKIPSSIVINPTVELLPEQQNPITRAAESCTMISRKILVAAALTHDTIKKIYILQTDTLDNLFLHSTHYQISTNEETKPVVDQIENNQLISRELI